MAKLAYTAVLGLGLLVLAGCAGQAVDSEQGLIASPVSPISDVPIPAGFHMADDSQTYMAPGQMRWAHHHYKGGDNYLSVAKFFRDQLPVKGWTLLSEQHNGAMVVLTFSKSTEDLVVTVMDGTFNTNVYVKLDPSNRNPPARQ